MTQVFNLHCTDEKTYSDVQQDVSGYGPDEARQLGKEAYRHGICRCPYFGGTMSQYQWWRGWKAEQALSGSDENV